MSSKSNFTLLVVAALCLGFIGGTRPAYADLGDQLFKLLPNDGAAVDFFGRSVAISNTKAIVGVPSDDDNGFASGSAYLFDTSTGAQMVKLLADDGSELDGFGVSVAITGPPGNEIAIVGASLDGDNGLFSGSAYLFDSTTGQQIAKLLHDDGAAFDGFGTSVAISGITAIVGVPGDDEASGSAFLFDATTGQQIGKFLANDGAAGDAFGGSVAISGPPANEVAIVGAHNDDDNGDASGSAYLFDVTTGQQIAKLLPSDGAATDRFGISVAIGGCTGRELALVGAPQDDDNGFQSGSAYLFDTTTGRQIAKLLADDGAAADFFGWSVAISGHAGRVVAIVGARWDDDNGDRSGSAYLFDVTTGQQIAKLLPDDGAADDLFGTSVAIGGPAGKEVAIVGADGNDDNGEDSGSAYLFDAAATTPCPWDLDGTGTVGVSDLLAFLADWGPCKGCPADFDGDDTVGLSDLLALLANWGPCP